MAEEDFEDQKVSLGTVVKWGTSLVGVVVFVTGLYFRLDNLQKAVDVMEARVHNLESNVIWRRQ